MIYWLRIFGQYCSQVAREWKRVDKLYKVNTYKEVMNFPSVKHDQWSCHWWCRVSPFSVDNLSMCYTELSLFPERGGLPISLWLSLMQQQITPGYSRYILETSLGILTFWETFSHTHLSILDPQIQNIYIVVSCSFESHVYILRLKCY